ncbi:MAG: S9 family peptidase [Dysgonamonadaceae bacterium]|jgi:dipeptidyl-peptidase-4|nr:S9 family peptidase [Dysgonamonadaceae bacterium]
MKSKIFIITALTASVLFFAANSNAQIELKDILSGKFSAQSVGGFRSTPDGEHFTRLSSDKKAILRYSWKTQQIIDTLFNVDKTRETRLDKIDGYDISSTGFRILVWKNVEHIYRHSWKADFYDYDVRRNFLKPLSEQTGKIMIPLFSPDGRMCAFVRDNNIWLKKFDYDTELQVTTDGELTKILNGNTDWVYEEEFGTTRLMSWSADSKFLAFVKTDESQVPLYRFQDFDGSLYPSFYEYKYPKPGETNSTVCAYAYDTDTKKIKKMEVPLDADGYIPEIRFTENPEQLAVMTFNRHQNRFDMYYVNPKSAVARLILHDDNPCYVDSDWARRIIFTKENFLYVSEKSGFAHIYLYNINGIPERQVTNGNYDITDVYGIDALTKTVYYQSAEESPLRRTVYKVDAKGVKTKLSEREGSNSATFSSTFKYYVNQYSNVSTPSYITLHDDKGKQLSVLKDNSELQQKLSTAHLPKKEFFTFTNESGETLNGWLLKPADFDPNRKYPVMMTQYSGPGSQTVLDRFELGWEWCLPTYGYIVASVDGRGTGARGDTFRKCTYQKLGVLESDDQIAGARYLGSLPYIDRDRIAIWGWSFGGYNVLMSLSCGNGIFRAGIAIAPVTDWRFYDSIYTERFMRTPQENENGYNISSPVKLAANLRGRLLLIHGTADDNVHFQNSVYYTKALEDNAIQFDQQIYPAKDHSIAGGKTREHLYTRVIDFLDKNLK